MEKLLAVTAIGPDRTGLVQELSNAITAAGGNIRESRMTTLGGEFAVLMLVSGNWHAVNKIRERLARLGNGDGDGDGLTITVRDTESRTPSPALPYTIDIISLDHEGIVLGLSSFFAERSLEIAELNSRRYNAPHTGAPMFAVQIIVNIPADVQVSALREEFLQYCDQENLDAIMEPAQR